MKLDLEISREEIEALVPYRDIAAAYRGPGWKRSDIRAWMASLSNADAQCAMRLCRTAKLWADKGFPPKSVRMTARTKGILDELGRRCLGEAEARRKERRRRPVGKWLRLERMPGTGGQGTIFAACPLDGPELEERLGWTTRGEYDCAEGGEGPPGRVWILEPPEGGPVDILVSLGADTGTS